MQRFQLLRCLKFTYIRDAPYKPLCEIVTSSTKPEVSVPERDQSINGHHHVHKFEKFGCVFSGRKTNRRTDTYFHQNTSHPSGWPGNLFIITLKQQILVKTHIYTRVNINCTQYIKLYCTVNKCFPDTTSDLTNRHVQTTNICTRLQLIEFGITDFRHYCINYLSM